MKLLNFLNIFNLRSKIKNSIFFRSVLLLAVGSSVGQLINLVFQPFITRIYSPEDMGVFSALLAIVSMWTVVSAGRYELAIVLPEEKKHAKAIVFLCLIIAVIVSFIAGFWYFLKHLLKFNSNSLFLKNYLFLFITPLVFINACDLILMKVAVREKQVRGLSLSQIGRQLGDKLTKIGLGVVCQRPISLIIGNIIGQLIRVCVIFYFVIESFFKDSCEVQRRDIFVVAKRYKKFPLVSSFSALLDVASVQVPIILLSSLFSEELVGYYGLCLAVLSVPMGVVGSSIGNVFVEKIARVKNDIIYVQNLTLNLFKKLLLIGTLGMSFIVMYGDLIFYFIFGKTWKFAGICAMWSAPGLVLVLAFSPLSSLFSVYEKIEQGFWLGAFSFFSSLIFIFLPYWMGMSELQVIISLAIGSLVSNIVLLIAIFKIIDINYLKTLSIICKISLPIYLLQGIIAFFVRRLF
ncbi:lipopolysaccharide biosynthesis protein [Treponema pedis]|uniref:lipopolysaccharide biosynthesis protein n=1 Tax=Treponema pedis TaxID=409322 RepID=UPI003133FBA5